MLAKKILSLQHPLVLHWTNLLKKRSYREETGRVLVSGQKLIRELFPDIVIQSLITTHDVQEIRSEMQFVVTDAIMKKITGLETPDGYAAEIALPSFQNLSSCRYVLILDRVADPGNLGNLVRAAYALGWEGVAATHGTVDFFNDKALRAAKGSTFRIPLARVESEEIALWKHTFFIADLEGEPLDKVAFQPPLALILGSEARGPGIWRGQKVHIPMQKGAESLNVASAGAIFLYAMRSL